MLLDYFSDIDWAKIIDLLAYNPTSPIIFSSGFFFFAFLLFLPIYGYLRPHTRMRILYVVIFSLFFYYKSSGMHCLLLLTVATIDHRIGLLLFKARAIGQKRRLMLLSIAINLGILCYFKYFNFLGDLATNLYNEVMHWFNPEHEVVGWSMWDILLPAGISFFTFQTMSYIIDLYRGDIRVPIRHWIDYLFYVSFFPQLVAGPIVRARDFIPQIRKYPELGYSEYSEALILIMSGLCKKAVISDYISLNFVDRIFDAPTLYTGFENLIGVYGYALQIYCDFSGYSDMAIGIALLLGFRFNINFDSPYQAVNITEFWRRWHISLSSWLKDYLYIPLGGSRKGKIRTYINLMLTMLLGGLWHGAALRFILWGAIHGVALALHKLWMSIRPDWLRRNKESVMGKWIGRLITFHLVCFAWIFFRASSYEVAEQVMMQIYRSFHPEIIFEFIISYPIVVTLMVVGYALHFMSQKRVVQFQNWFGELGFWYQVLFTLIVLIFVAQMRSAEIQPFIYFQF